MINASAVDQTLLGDQTTERMDNEDDRSLRSFVRLTQR